MSKNSDQFFVALLFHLLLPLLPIIVEYSVNSMMSIKTLQLAASMYCISIGMSSTFPLQRALAIFLSVLGSILYANVEANFSYYIPWGLISLVFVVHTIERFRLHIIDGKDYVKI